MFEKRKDIVFKPLKTLLDPIGIGCYYTDDWGVYECHLGTEKHEVGKCNTQKIERKNLNLKTWIKHLARKPLCFSKNELMHDTVIGLLINKVEFGIDLHAKVQV
jgi:insertion element IS1 protein InsB